LGSDGTESLPLLLLAASLALLAFSALLLRAFRRPRHRRGEDPLDLSDPQVHLALANSENFRIRPILNGREREVFYALRDAIRTAYKTKYLLFAQVPMGVFLQCGSDNAFRSINSKRVDFLVTNTKGDPVLVIEYQGSGHYQGSASVRDEVKRVACRSAGLELYEIVTNTRKEDYQNLVIERLLHLRDIQD
jgi:hypothetical protein